MLGFSRSFGYLIKALSCVPDPGNPPARVGDIAKATGIPRPYLAKLVHILGKSGALETIRGRRGGIRLTKPASEWTLHQLIELFEGADVFERCLLGLTTCDDKEACPSHEFWKSMRETISHRLREITLDDVRHFQRFTETRVSEPLSLEELLESGRARQPARRKSSSS